MSLLPHPDMPLPVPPEAYSAGARRSAVPPAPLRPPRGGGGATDEPDVLRDLAAALAACGSTTMAAIVWQVVDGAEGPQGPALRAFPRPDRA